MKTLESLLAHPKLQRRLNHELPSVRALVNAQIRQMVALGIMYEEVFLKLRKQKKDKERDKEGEFWLFIENLMNTEDKRIQRALNILIADKDGQMIK